MSIYDYIIVKIVFLYFLLYFLLTRIRKNHRLLLSIFLCQKYFIMYFRQRYYFLKR